ncbi:mitochondrial inner membrane protein [Scheffersomyces stipitis CBS 6054]|uniref:MICOS complex subunit MIC60 n=1 Tax=Scheffersomyces stipitis (strain ATCC 58785 / CBS 6054 / NBRC 10063 / NRRL Y-11545) TaxID=322104 RepID=MIC60_PICST|nr:mitochondrial inner membrane protein [Scheffersomyces stipitis CBS 6054]A3LQS0.2 RecName: Full=MICOS complex subunit MIC60; AltName: Full=Mitofilin; Flags: Precursor [Scheffersomyces stipitis CBS 6054]ABN65250.2 mitochondrial inner membrane protein [Scheffersomyces stipitis CBS 6054]
MAVRPLSASARVWSSSVSETGKSSQGQDQKHENYQNHQQSSLAGIVIKSALFATVVYGATMFIATKNDKVMDFVIDQQIPYYEETIDLIENGSYDDLVSAIKAKISSIRLPSKDEITELSHKIEHTSEDLLKETKRKLESARAEFGSHSTAGSGTSASLPANQLQKHPEIEHVKKEVEHLPAIKLNENVVSYVDASVKATIDSFNDLINSIDVSKVTPTDEGLIKTINEKVSELASKVGALSKKFDDELQSKLKVSQTELLSSYTKKELELTENLLHQFNRERAQLESKLNERLKQEIAATKETISQAAVNAVSMVRIEQTKNFEKLVADKINEERNGKLANLEKLNSRLESLEQFAESLESQVVATQQKSVIQKSLSSLKAVLFVSNPEEKPQSIKPYVDDLFESSPDDEVIQLALGELGPLLSKESTQSILTTSQLLTRWEQLVPELRSASLLPPNAGLLGHLASIVFSKFLVSVKGDKPDGKDIESVIGRVEASLVRDELDVAVEEVANLKGWTRKLANDWVIEGRKRLEAEYLVELIDAETRIL